MMFNREVFYDSVRDSLFAGSLKQQQVEGMDIILDTWELWGDNYDRRKLGYMFATTYHETAQKMQPVAEYGKGSGQSYGKQDPETKQTYYGRGFVQLTWRDNYARADREMNWSGDQSCEWNADLQLQAVYAAPTMFHGMFEGWFRSKDGAPETLERHFNDEMDDPDGARNIINGDQNVKPSWGGGKTMPQIITGYYMKFTAALNQAFMGNQPAPTPPKSPVVRVIAPPGVTIIVEAEE